MQDSLEYAHNPAEPDSIHGRLEYDQWEQVCLEHIRAALHLQVHLVCVGRLFHKISHRIPGCTAGKPF